MPRVRLPGLTDVHVHLRVPGGEHKEDLRTGTSAAIAGGFTSVLAMPNTKPPLVTLRDLHSIQTRVATDALCDVHHFAGASPDHLNELSALSRESAGLKIYLDQTYGPLRVTDLATLLACFRLWPGTTPIAMHAEGPNVALGIGLAAAYLKPVHFCHVSRRDEIELIAQAKARGLPITCEVAPHHLFLSTDDLPRLGALGDMRPPLAAPDDVAALWEHVNTTVDCIATDHAPHTLAEKAGDNPPPGVPGLETALPLMLTAVHEGRLNMERLIYLMSIRPREVFGLPQQPDTWIEVDTGAEYELSNDGLHTRCGWTPFAGMRVRGKLQRVTFQGKTVFEDGVLARRRGHSFNQVQ
jgi:carbamoyl-phosphate synthase/aspartate carbamoyltransferase/dihydroorotase